MGLLDVLNDPVNQTAAARVGCSLLIGALIGIERSHHGRPAGFRTHALVCMASAMLMLVGIFETKWLPDAERVRTLDPTRLAQGIMTGIGFLGAGTIVKEGLSVQGLTTAASIWITSAIGILIGVGLYMPASITAALTILTLAGFRWLEACIPVQFTACLSIRFTHPAAPDEDRLRALLQEHGFSVTHVDYRWDFRGHCLEYQIMLTGRRGADARRLSAVVFGLEGVDHFSIATTGE